MAIDQDDNMMDKSRDAEPDEKSRRFWIEPEITRMDMVSAELGGSL